MKDSRSVVKYITLRSEDDNIKIKYKFEWDK